MTDGYGTDSIDEELMNRVSDGALALALATGGVEQAAAEKEEGGEGTEAKLAEVVVRSADVADGGDGKKEADSRKRAERRGKQ